MIKSYVSIALALVACSKKQDQPAAKADKPAAEKVTEPAAKKPAAELFTGKTATLPAPFAKLSFGMTEAEAKAAAPDVFAEKYGSKVLGYDGVEASAQIEQGRLYQAYLKIREPEEQVKKWLAAKWGEPRAEKNSIGTPEYYWDAPEVHLRAKLEPVSTDSILRFGPVMSIDEVLGTDPKKLGIERVALIGATPEQVLEAYKVEGAKPRDDDPSSIACSLPPIAGSEYGATLDARVKNGKVTGYSFSVPSLYTDKLAARLEQMYGKGKPDTTGLYTDYKATPKVKAELRKNDPSFSSVVWVGDTHK